MGFGRRTPQTGPCPQREDRLERTVSSEGVFVAYILAFNKPKVHRGNGESDTCPRSVRECSGQNAGKLKRCETPLGESGLEGRAKSGFPVRVGNPGRSGGSSSRPQQTPSSAMFVIFKL